MIVQNRRIESDVVAEVPSQSRILEVDDALITRPYQNVEIEIHAQDLDRSKAGWAGIIQSISSERLKMQIYDPIKPEDLYTKASVKGDVIVVSKEDKDGDMQPFMFYLIRLSE